MRKYVLFLSLFWVMGVVCYGQQSDRPAWNFNSHEGSSLLQGQSQYNTKTINEDVRVLDIQNPFRLEKVTKDHMTKEKPSHQNHRKNLPLGKQRIADRGDSKPGIPVKISPTLEDDQCAYTFRLLDDFGDGWNGALMQVYQNGQLVDVLGEDFHDGYEYTQQVTLIDGINFEVFWFLGGDYPEEVGLEITDAFGDQVYYAELIGWGNVGTTIFSDIVICTPLSCPRPANLDLVSAATVSAQINWTENGDATLWDLEYGTPGFADGQGTMIEGITTRPYEITGLNASTSYEVRVRAVCSEEDISPWSVRLKFNTLCEPFAVPFLENFDQISAPDLPLCWSGFYTGDWGMVEVTDYVYNSSPNSVVMYFEDETTVYLVMPEFDLEINNLFLFFSARLWIGSAQLEIGVLEFPNLPSSFVLVETISISDSWNGYSVDFSGFTGTNGQIAFRYGYNANNYFGVALLDDIYVNEMESCPSPVQLGVSFVTFESARLGWTPFGAAQTWDVEYGVQGFEPGQGTLVESVSQTHLDIEGLEEDTWYQFYVRSVCEDETSSWSMPFSFKTNVEGECYYTFVLMDTYGDGWDDTRMHVIQNGQIVAVLGENFQEGYSIPVEVLLMDGLEFEIFWAVEGYWPEEVGLEIIDPFGDQLYYELPIGWNMVGQTIFTDIAICTPPTCPRPNELLASEITTGSALVNWSENGTATQWDIEYGEAGFTEGQGTLISGITSKPYLLTDLDAATMYEFRVRAVCSEEDISNWSQRRRFATLCELFSLPLVEGFDQVMLPELPLCWDVVGEGEFFMVETTDFFFSSAPNSLVMIHDYYSRVMLVAPPVNLVVTDVQLKFKAMYYDGNNRFNVGVVTDPTDASTFTTIQTITLGGQGVWTEYMVYFADYTGGDGQIAFRIGSLDEMNYSIVLLDDIEIDYLPVCPAPYNLHASAITTSSAMLQWNDVGSGSEWDIEWGLAPFSPGEGTLVEGISQPSYLLNDLSASTFYQFYVRAFCPENETSDWSVGFTFATACAGLELPYADNFDLLANGQLPLCWNEYGLGTWGYDYYVGATSFQSHSAPMSMAIGQWYTLAMLISPQIELPLNTLEVKFHARLAEGDDNSLQIGAITNINDPSGYEVVNAVSLSSQWQYYTVLLENYSGSAGHLAFVSGQPNGGKWGTVLIDNLEITVSEPAVYNVTFKVHNSVAEPIEGATIEITDEGTITTQANGEATHGLHNGHYQFTISADNFEPYTGEFTVHNDHLVVEITLLSVNVDERIAESVVLYPNPFDGQVFVKNAQDIRKVIITNVTGQTVLEWELSGDHSVRINTSDFVKGIYFVQLYHTNGSHTVHKIVKR